MQVKQSLLAIALIVVCAGAYAASANQQLSQQDKMWLEKAHQSNLAEIKLGKMAESKGHSSAVREAGKILRSDHEQLDAKLKPVAERLNVSLPESPSQEEQAVAKMLSDKSGMQFDEAWVKNEISDHEKAISKTKNEISQVSSHEVQMLAKNTLPVLEKHLHMLRRTADKIHGGG